MTNDWKEYDWSEAEMEAFGRAIAAKLREPRVPDMAIPMDFDEDLEEDSEPDWELVDHVMARVRQYGPYIPYPTPHLRGHLQESGGPPRAPDVDER